MANARYTSKITSKQLRYTQLPLDSEVKVREFIIITYRREKLFVINVRTEHLASIDLRAELKPAR